MAIASFDMSTCIVTCGGFYSVDTYSLWECCLYIPKYDGHISTYHFKQHEESIRHKLATIDMLMLMYMKLS